MSKFSNSRSSIINFCSGQSLIEVLLIVVLITTVIAGDISFLTRAYVITQSIAEQTTAVHLGAEGLEIVKNLIDANCDNGIAWNNITQSGNYAPGDYEVDYNSAKLQDKTSQDHKLYFDSDSNFYGYKASYTSLNAIESPYVRTLTIENTETNSFKIDSKVEWSSRGGSQSVILTTHYYNLCK